MSVSSDCSVVTINTVTTALPAYAVEDCGARPPRYESLRSSRRSTNSSCDTHQAQNHDPSEGASAGQPQRLGGQQWTTHRLQLKRRWDRAPWVTIRLKSCANDAADVPHFCSGSVVKGFITLDPNSLEQIRSISLQVQGKLVERFQSAGALNADNMPARSSTFCEQKDIIWSQSSASKSMAGHHIPFATSFPSSLSANFSVKGQSARLPPSFEEANSAVAIKYEMVWLFEKNGILTSISRLGIDVTYTPLDRPEPFSLLREIAYRNKLAVPDYLADPDGWMSVTFNRAGKIHGKDVMMNGVLRLPKPLCYTRGYQVPVRLEAAVCSPMTIEPRKLFELQLRRLVHILKPTVCLKNAREQDYFVMDVKVGCAKWRRVDQMGQAVRLDGELYVHPQLQPSCFLPFSAIDYYVSLRPSKVVDIVRTMPSQVTAIVQQPVEVASLLPNGPAPPSYKGPPTRPKWITRRNALTESSLFAMSDLL
ncbi:hypothetical protein CYLTODRAFT_493040 [Cylindrobasidium torrendii FP15055 ss-10]|uniref:Arrestin-like N-terminal domain-containing protein n=1 Tax=Cylindrobasidium torrendii FP15055 ss-10 TaxID=1314674 RepID=A0A0D7B2Y0_9AGAR|nr:hypothetical protein CYLTODRAFT_493040 [Cylindrobasidium torrendii FP15055 ss-10]